MNKLATQTITISSLLGGFSIAVIANFLVSEVKTKILNSIMILSILAASCFLISVFSWTSIVMMTTEGYPLKEVTQSDLLMPRIVGVFSFFGGITALISMISLSGWTKSKKMGKFTTVVGIITFIMLMLLSS